jgi:hypothetical protein
MDKPTVSQNVADFPANRRPFLEYDEITGFYYDPADYAEPEQEYWVVDLPDSLGISYGLHATFPTRRQAQEWQLAHGMRATTKIVGWPDD